MCADVAGEAYFTSSSAAAAALGLPLLGSLQTEPRFHQLAESLSSLAPDPRFSERIYRFLHAESPLIWVVGLGDAGEEIPVAVGVAEMAAQAGAAPVLLVRPIESPPLGASGMSGRAVHSHRFAEALDALFPSGCVGQSTGIQGVFRGWPQGSAEGAPLEPGAVVIAGRSEEEGFALPPEQTSHVLLVVPFRDQPMGRLVACVRDLRAAGYPLVGFVAFGLEDSSEGTGDHLATAAGEAAPATTAEASAAADVRSEAGSGVTPSEEVAVEEPWSATFGPRAQSEGLEDWAQPERRPSSHWRHVGIAALLIAMVAVAAWMLRSRFRPADAPVREPVRETVTAAPPPLAAVAAVVAAPPIPAVADSASHVAETAPDSTGVRVASDSLAVEPASAIDAAAVGEIRDMVAVSTGPFTVLCGSFSSAARAANEIMRLGQAGLGARALSVRIPGRGVWYRVVVGGCASAAEARALAEEIVGAGTVSSAQVVAADGWGRPVGAPLREAAK